VSREFRSLLATLLLTLAGFLVVRQLVTATAEAADWSLPLVLALVGLVLALLPDRAAAVALSPVPVLYEPAPPPLPAADDLTLIKGIGPLRAQALAQQRCTRFSDLAQLDEPELARMLQDVGAAPPPPALLRSWIRQATIAAAGDLAALRAFQAQLAPDGAEPA